MNELDRRTICHNRKLGRRLIAFIIENRLPPLLYLYMAVFRTHPSLFVQIH